ncbi:MAG: hypothetical protein ACHQ50_07760 [Fimbriimonadales bacterium]
MDSAAGDGARKRRRLWCAFGAICLLAIAIGYLTRPEDDFAYLRVLHPTEELRQQGPRDGVRVFTFPMTFNDVRPYLRGRVVGTGTGLGAHSEAYIEDRVLEDGTPAMFEGSPYAKPCILTVAVKQSTWYERAWLALKRRLGLG